MGLNFEDSDTTSPGTGHHLRRVARTTPPRPELETRTLPPRLRDKRSGGGGGLPNPTPRCSPAGDEKGVRPPWAAHNYLQDSGHCGRGASSIGRPSGTVGWPWNSRLESSGLTATRMDDTWPRSPADSARPGVARRPATRRPSQSTPALADSTAATRIAALDHGTLYVSLGSSSAVGGPAGWMTRNIARDNSPTAADKHPRTTTCRPVLTSQ